jgi:hypothetical protein
MADFCGHLECVILLIVVTSVVASWAEWAVSL